jgi:AAHS family 4-hydroxybenzoate transporter-like MFS transporter
MSVRTQSEPPPRAIDVGEVIEQQRIGALTLRLVILCALVTFFDGYDMNVIGYATPYLAPLYHLSKPMLAMIFSAGNAGPLVGGFLFGALGDRWGRRPALILATSIFGVLTLSLALAHRYEEFLVLRFLNGIALGGAMPLTWALGTEYVPRRLRASIVTLILMGYGLGVVAAGPISIALIPRFGWTSVFVFGGTLSLLASAVLLAALPESLRYLATRQTRPALMARLVNALSPATAASASSRFVIGDEARREPETRRLAGLFRGDLKVITPLLWAAYVASSMTAYFFTNWGPHVYEALGFARNTAAWIASGNSVAGMIGALALMRFTDRFGVASVAAFPAIAVPLLMIVAFASLPQGGFIAVVVLLSIFLNGGHFGIQSIIGLFYPTADRALGTGWAASMAKIGSIAGPLLGGWILASSLPVKQTFAVMAICPALFCACVLAIGSIQRARR